MSDSPTPHPDIRPQAPMPPPTEPTAALTPPPASASTSADDIGFEDFAELAPRPRRRLATPLHLGLAAVLATALGFVGGVLVEKGQTSAAAGGAGSGRRAAAGLGAGSGGAAGARGAAAAGATLGTITSIAGRTLYLTDTQGTTIKVTPSPGAKVVRTATSPVAAIHPGDTAIVQGTRAPDGSLTASSIRATSPNAAGGGGGFGGPGGPGGGGGAVATPAAPAAGRTTPAPPLFGG